jgi:hypothetical protein
MASKWSTGFSVVVGVTLGLVVSYFGLNYVFAKGLTLLVNQASSRMAVLEDQMQGMADESLEMRHLLLNQGFKPSPGPFQAIEKSRAVMAGTLDLNEKISSAEDLEAGLLASLEEWKKAGKARKKIASNFYWQDWGRRWNGRVRYLVKDEEELIDAAAEYDHMLGRWPVSWIAKGYTLSRMAEDSGLAKAGRQFEAGSRALLEKQLKKGLTFQVGRVWLGVKPQDKSSRSEKAAKRGKGMDSGSAYLSLKLPEFKAKAPLPEDFYDEIQYRQMTSMVDVGLGEEKPVLDRDEKLPGFDDAGGKKKKKKR